MPKKDPKQFYLQSNAFHSSLENCQIFKPLLLEKLLPRTFKNRPIWSHWWQRKLEKRMRLCNEKETERVSERGRQFASFISTTFNHPNPSFIVDPLTPAAA